MSEDRSKKPIPRFVEARKFAGSGAKLEGLVPYESLQRLSEVASQAVVHVSLEFGIDEQHRRFIRGDIDASLTVVCQRCLAPVVYPLKQAVSLAMVSSEEAAQQLPSYYEALFVSEEEPCDLYQQLEEEMLLGLPAVVYHDELCVDASEFVFGDAQTQAASEIERKNPFDVLSDLKKK